MSEIDLPEQRLVFEAVVARGYLDPWTLIEFVHRQLWKLQEELAELFDAAGYTALNHLTHDDERDDAEKIARQVESAGKTARSYFTAQTPEFYKILPDIPMNPAKVAAELADMQVVLFCLAQALQTGWEELEHFNVNEMALAKSRFDIRRGIRK